MLKFLTRTPKRQPSIPGPRLAVDLHSHLIPGIDDGAQSGDEALLLLKGLYDAGYRKCITTPHVYAGLYENTPAAIEAGLQQLREIIRLNSISMEVEAAAEYFFDHHFFELIAKQELLTFGQRYVLFELPVSGKPAMLDDMIFKMRLAGYQPVLAHPERYPYLHDRNMRAYQRLKEQEVFFQLNLMSLTGYYADNIRLASVDLIKHNMIEFAGSDIHKQKHIPVIHKALHDDSFRQLLASGKLLNDKL